MPVTSTIGLLVDEHRARLGPQARAVAHRARDRRGRTARSARFVRSLDDSRWRRSSCARMPSNRIAHSPVEWRPSHATLTRLSPVPCSSTSRCFSPSLFHGLSRSILNAFASDLTMFDVQPRVLRDRLAPHRDRAVADRARRIGDDEIRIGGEPLAEAVALDAHAERRVEREALRRQLGEADAARRARVRLASTRAGSSRPATSTMILPLPSRSAVSTESVRRPLSLRVDRDAIDHELDRVLLLLLERVDVVEAHDHAVDAHAHEAGLAQLDEQLAELALAVLGLRREHA